MTRTKPPGPSPPLKRGILLGLLAAVMASLLLWSLNILVGLLSGEGWIITSWDGDPYGVLVLAVAATIVVSLLPGAIGGAANASVLYWLSSRGRLTRATSLASGLLVGFLAGFATIPGASLISGDIGSVFRYGLAETVEFALIVACVAAPVGGWHGWGLGKWLMESP